MAGGDDLGNTVLVDIVDRPGEPEEKLCASKRDDYSRGYLRGEQDQDDATRAQRLPEDDREAYADTARYPFRGERPDQRTGSEKGERQAEGCGRDMKLLGDIQQVDREEDAGKEVVCAGTARNPA